MIQYHIPGFFIRGSEVKSIALQLQTVYALLRVLVTRCGYCQFAIKVVKK